MITVPGRILREPRIFYKKTKPARVAFGSWNLVDVEFNTAGNLTKWSYLLISRSNFRDAFDFSSLNATIGKLQTVLTATGIKVASPRPGKTLVLDSPDDPQLDGYLEMASRAVDLLVVILPDSNTELYSRIKKCGDTKDGLHTICSVGTKLAKEWCQEQYLGNLALKFNLKLGGNNHLLDSARLGIINEDKTMVVGIDVTHPSPGSSSNAPSVAAMVASVDKFLGQWPSVL